MMFKRWVRFTLYAGTLASQLVFVYVLFGDNVPKWLIVCLAGFACVTMAGWSFAQMSMVRLHREETKREVARIIQLSERIKKRNEHIEKRGMN